MEVKIFLLSIKAQRGHYLAGWRSPRKSNELLCGRESPHQTIGYVTLKPKNFNKCFFNIFYLHDLRDTKKTLHGHQEVKERDDVGIFHLHLLFFFFLQFILRGISPLIIFFKKNLKYGATFCQILIFLDKHFLDKVISLCSSC